MVEAVGIELGFQSHAGALAVVDTTFSMFVQIVAGIELNTGAVCMDFHGSAGNRIRENGAGIAVYFPVMIVAALQMQRLIIHADVSCYWFGAA